MHRLLGRAGTRTAFIVVLLGLLLVPLLLRGQHADHAATGRPCAVCVVAKHSPAASAPAPAVVGLVLRGVGHASPLCVRPVHRTRCAETGRAPPPPPTGSVA